MSLEPVKYTKFESPKQSTPRSRKNLIIPKPRRATAMRNVESTSGAGTSTNEQQIGAGNIHRNTTSFSNYFSIKSLAVLACITICLLVLPLVLPPLAPPPSLLLLVPIGILLVLLILAVKYNSSAPHISGLHL